MRLVLVAVSVACIGAGLLIAGHIAWFVRSSSVHGAALVQRERRAISVSRPAASACQSLAHGYASAASGEPQGLLEIPGLGLTAPVLQGTGDAVLADVTWFSGVGRLRSGDEVRYVMPCRTFTYRVTSHRVVAAGYPVYNTSTARIVLDTCYPLDALYLTGSRYLVYADLVETSPTSPIPAPPASPSPLLVPAPKALVAEGLNLEQNEAPLGVLSFSGSPSATWRQTSAPLQTETSVLTAYFAIVRSAEQANQGWWADLASSWPESAAAGLWGGQITGYDTSLDITLRVRGTRVLGATLTAEVSSAGSRQPGTYDLAVTETVTGDELLVSSFAMHPAG